MRGLNNRSQGGTCTGDVAVAAQGEQRTIDIVVVGHCREYRLHINGSKRSGSRPLINKLVNVAAYRPKTAFAFNQLALCRSRSSLKIACRALPRDITW